MTKFVVFTSWSAQLLQEDMNKWLENNPHVRVKRTQLAQSESDQGNSFKISALISYEVAVEKS